MPQLATRYICQQCGAESAKWQGRCYSCGAWSSLVEVAVPKKSKAHSGINVGNGAAIIALGQVQTENLPRIPTGFSEMDRVLGGGLVPGGVVLVGGEPGIGKSTLLLQVLLHTGGLYVTAEESSHQVKLRADRIKYSDNNDIQLLSSNNVDHVISEIEKLETPPPIVIIDSIQTVSTTDLDGVPGSVGQVRESANRLVNLAKQQNLPMMIVSHVTKEGTIAGPKVLEHLVDAVIYVEGEELSMLRLVRGVKNRFGAVHEVGLFELRDIGMSEVLDSAQMLIPQNVLSSGSVITATMEGVRPMLLEVQALATATSFGLPRRTANGMDLNRLQMLLAVLSKRTKLNLSNQDVYTNIAGGMKIRETALDLAVCLALASSVTDQPLPDGTIAFGEVGLSGEIKPVMGQAKRLEQAAKLGYSCAITADTVKTVDQAIRVAFNR